MSRVIESLDSLDRRWSASLCMKDLPASPGQILPRQWPVALCARLADGPLWIAIGVAATVWGSTGLRETVLGAVTAVALTACVVGAVKFVVRRERPRGAESALWSTIPRYDHYSFPSGHAARAACIAVVAASADTRLLVPGMLLTLAVASSRVILGIHYLLDVVCGAAVGALTAQVALLLLR